MKKYLMLFTLALMVMMLAACGSSSDSSTQEGSAGGSSAGEASTAESVHPYAWLGFQDMPECDYLDALAANHYYKESDVYISKELPATKEIEAADGANSYKDNGSIKVYTVDGKVIGVTESSKTYSEQDISDLSESANEKFEAAMKDGTNLYGRSLKSTGSGTIPVYCDVEGDKNEYEYYEYYYPDSKSSTTELYYFKDGDVFATCTRVESDDSTIEQTQVITKMTEDIPDGIFDIPDLSGYEKVEL